MHLQSAFAADAFECSDSEAQAFKPFPIVQNICVYIYLFEQTCTKNSTSGNVHTHGPLVTAERGTSEWIHCFAFRMSQIDTHGCRDTLELALVNSDMDILVNRVVQRGTELVQNWYRISKN